MPMTDPDIDPRLDLPPHYPFQRLIGFRKLAMTDGFARFALDLRDDLMNALNIPHGGVHALLLDNALGAAGCFAGEGLPPRRAVTLNLNVSYLAVPDGKMLIVEGRRVGGGRKVYFAEGMVRDDTGKELARATGTFRYID
jgi:uncharacterized protein (TIGR00369 family)